MKSMMSVFLWAAVLEVAASEGDHPVRAVDGNNLINISWGDNIMIGSGVSKLDTPDKIISSLETWNKFYAGETILWRISSEYLQRYYERRRSPFQAAYDAKVEEIGRTFDPVKLVRDETRRLRQKFLLYATFLDHGAPTNNLYGGAVPFPWQDRVTIAHPEYQERDLQGNFHYGVLDLSEPEARAFMVKRLADFVTEYDADGLYLCSRTHSVPALHGDQFGFGPNIVNEYKKRYGIDITSDPRFDWKSPSYAPHSREVENWRRLRGEYLLTFLQELRMSLGHKLLYTGLPGGDYFGAPCGNMRIDLEKIIARKLVDGLVLGVISGRSLYPMDKTPHKDKGYLLSYDDNYNIPSREETIGRFAPLCTRNDIALFFLGGYRRNHLEPGLDGVMINAPSARRSLFIESSSLFSADSLSIDGWFQLSKEQVAEAPRLISKYSHASDVERGWELWVNQTSSRPEFRTHLLLPDGSRRDLTLTAKQAIPREAWVHIAAVFDRRKCESRLYINGRPAGMLTLPPGSKLNDNAGVDLMLGSYAGGGQEARMMVDELRISSLPQTFSAAPQEPYTGQEPGTLALFHFDSPEGTADAIARGLKPHFIGKPPMTSGRFGRGMDMTD